MAVTQVVEEHPKRLNRHIVVALAHMNKRRSALLEKRAEIDREVKELDAAILALE
jgi:hypothetical protein